MANKTFQGEVISSVDASFNKKDRVTGKETGEIVKLWRISLQYDDSYSDRFNFGEKNPAYASAQQITKGQIVRIECEPNARYDKTIKWYPVSVVVV